MHRRKQIRLKEYDYSSPGAYFVTICVHNWEPIFGEIADGGMRLNRFGTIAQSCWNDIPVHFPTIMLDEYIVMPNHIHGIIVISDELKQSVGARSPRPYGKPTLGNIVAYFKYQSAKQINVLRNTPGCSVWQRNYYEHIIRNEQSLNRIREYIATNPARWHRDRNKVMVDVPHASDH